MNHRDTEDTEKKKKNDEQKAKIVWTILLVVLLACGFTLWVAPLIEWGVNYAKWNMQRIEEYNLYFSEAGIILPLGSTESIEHPAYDTDGTVHHMELSRMVKPEYDDAVDLIFETAFSRIWKLNPFNRCSVGYDSNYGFPSHIGCGSLKRPNGGWWYVKYFEPKTKNQ